MGLVEFDNILCEVKGVDNFFVMMFDMKWMFDDVVFEHFMVEWVE